MLLPSTQRAGVSWLPRVLFAWGRHLRPNFDSYTWDCHVFLLLLLLSSKVIKKSLNYLLSLSFHLKRGHFSLKKKALSIVRISVTRLDFPHFAGGGWKRRHLGCGDATSRLDGPPGLRAFPTAWRALCSEGRSFPHVQVCFRPTAITLEDLHPRGALWPLKFGLIIQFPSDWTVPLCVLSALSPQP